jgi:hypothetical protein
MLELMMLRSSNSTTALAAPLTNHTLLLAVTYRIQAINITLLLAVTYRILVINHTLLLAVTYRIPVINLTLLLAPCKLIQAHLRAITRTPRLALCKMIQPHLKAIIHTLLLEASTSSPRSSKTFNVTRPLAVTRSTPPRQRATSPLLLRALSLPTQPTPLQSSNPVPWTASRTRRCWFHLRSFSQHQPCASDHRASSQSLRLGTPRSNSSISSPHLASPHLSSPLLTSPLLTSPLLTSPLLTSLHITSPFLSSPLLCMYALCTCVHVCPVVVLTPCFKPNQTIKSNTTSYIRIG